MLPEVPEEDLQSGLVALSPLVCVYTWLREGTGEMAGQGQQDWPLQKQPEP